MKSLSMVAIAACIAVLAALPANVLADPCLVVYPIGDCIYHYDTAEYYTVGPGDPLYDPVYDRGGEVLLEVGTDEIDQSIYQAPGLAGFTPSTDGNEGFVFMASDFDLVIDGWSPSPTTLVNVLLVFDEFDPAGCSPTVTVEGTPVDAGSGWTYAVGDLVVSTPTPEGNNYSDTITVHVVWSGCIGMRMWAFSDENDNGIHDGGECFTAFSHDAVVPTSDRTWTAVKALFE
jgi:hypothetical protein